MGLVLGLGLGVEEKELYRSSHTIDKKAAVLCNGPMSKNASIMSGRFFFIIQLHCSSYPVQLNQFQKDPPSRSRLEHMELIVNVHFN